MTDTNWIREQFHHEGRVWLRNALPPEELIHLKSLSVLEDRPGARVPNSDPLFKAVETASINDEIKRIWPNMRPIRLISFDKNASANWGVPWHQDRIIAVKEKYPFPGYENWSQKSGTWHCEPPTDLLSSMLFVRLHLDKNTAENGAMEIAPGSHHEGKISAEQAASVAAKYKTELTIAEPGDVLVLTMLTLHRSPTATSDTGRHTLRIDYAPSQLPPPLSWAS